MSVGILPGDMALVGNCDTMGLSKEEPCSRWRHGVDPSPFGRSLAGAEIPLCAERFGGRPSIPREARWALACLIWRSRQISTPVPPVHRTLSTCLSAVALS